MRRETIERLARHARAENRARVGTPYPDRTAEREWARANLPATRRDFEAVVEAVKREWAGARASEVAVLLAGVRYAADLHRAWPAAAKWLSRPSRPRKQRPACTICGAPAIGRSNLAGPACENHYDANS